MLLKEILCLFLFHSYTNAQLGKSPEPEEYWPHSETPDELEEQLQNFRKEFDKHAGLQKKDPCDPDSPVNKAYIAMNEALRMKNNFYAKTQADEDAKYDFFDPKHANYAVKTLLDKELNAIKQPGSSHPKSVCPITKGLICNKKEKKCLCNQGDGVDTDFKLEPQSKFKEGSDPNDPTSGVEVKIKTKYDATFKICYLDTSDSYCNEDWETKCRSPYKCYIEKDDNQPEDDLLCTYLNLEKYNLINEDGANGAIENGDWKCHCGPSAEARQQDMKALLKKVQDLTPDKYLHYEADCEEKYETSYETLEKILVSSLDISGFSRDDLRQLQTALNDESDDNDKIVPALCSKNPDALLVCHEKTKKCACKYDGSYDPVSSSCRLNSRSQCDSDGRPYLCPSGEKCLIEVKQNTLCTPVTLKDLSKFDGISKKCICSSATFSPKGKFSTKDLKDLDNAALTAVAALVEAEAKPEKWTYLKMGDTCDWMIDRKFFEMHDYIRAGLQHIFFNSEFYKDILRMEDKKDSNGNKIPKAVCNIEKSMRCHFKERKCDCPIDGFLLEDIPSEYNAAKDKCFLKSRSLCHPTLTEWLSCPGEEKCLYTSDNVNILCNRANQKLIVKNKMRLKSAKCYCSMETVRDFDNALIKKLRYKEKIEF